MAEFHLGSSQTGCAQEDTVAVILILLEKEQGRHSIQESGHEALAVFIGQLFHNKLCHWDQYLGMLR